MNGCRKVVQINIVIYYMLYNYENAVVIKVFSRDNRTRSGVCIKCENRYGISTRNSALKLYYSCFVYWGYNKDARKLKQNSSRASSEN